MHAWLGRQSRAAAVSHTQTHSRTPPGLRTTTDGVGCDGGRLYSSKVRAREEGKKYCGEKGSVFPVSRLPRDTHRHRCAHSRALGGGGTIFCLSSGGSASAATVAVVVLSGSSEIHESTGGGGPDVALVTFRWHNRRSCQSARHLHTTPDITPGSSVAANRLLQAPWRRRDAPLLSRTSFRREREKRKSEARETLFYRRRISCSRSAQFSSCHHLHLHARLYTATRWCLDVAESL